VTGAAVPGAPPHLPGGTLATRAVWLTVGWTLLLAALAALWVRSPFLGSGTAFVVWSLPAAVAFAVSWRWLRARKLPQLPLTWGLLAAILVLWGAGLGLAASDVGSALALDGRLLRRPWLHGLGVVARWAPLVFGLGVSLASVAAGLEARYRLVRTSAISEGTPSHRIE